MSMEGHIGSMTGVHASRFSQRPGESPTWHVHTSEEVAGRLGVAVDQGLPHETVQDRRAEFGANELIDTGGRSPLQILWEQLRSAMIVLLVAALLVSAYLSEYIDAAAILAIIVLNAALGFVQDYRAERALAALKKLAVPRVKVRRDGFLQEVSAETLVPGDIVVLETGNLVPADCRILNSLNLRLQEGSLTGESEPVDKHATAIKVLNLPVADRGNMASR